MQPVAEVFVWFLRLLCRFSVSLPVSLFPSICDMMMEMCIPGGLLIKTQEIWLLISSKHHSLSLFAKGKYVAGICPERIDLPASPTKNWSLPPAVTESYQSRGCEVCWERLSSNGHYCHCISLTHGERHSNAQQLVADVQTQWRMLDEAFSVILSKSGSSVLISVQSLGCIVS